MTPRLWKSDGIEAEGFVITVDQVREVQAAMADFKTLLATVRTTLNDLPVHRDWLDPQVEQVLREITTKYVI